MDLRSGRDVSELAMNVLPLDCISRIVSLTSPKNACVSAAVSSDWSIAANSDLVWERFLPSNYPDILSRAVTPIHFTSKKDLFFRLCNPILVDGGGISISLEKSTGKICYMFSAKELHPFHTWRTETRDWSWSTLPDSRFENVAGPMDWDFFTFETTVRSTNLSPNTTYAAYVVYKLIGDVAKELLMALDYCNTHGVDGGVYCIVETCPINATAGSDEELSRLSCCVPFSIESADRALFSLRQENTIDYVSGEDDAEHFFWGHEYFATEREDHWMEHGMGEFLNSNADEEKNITITRLFSSEVTIRRDASIGVIIEGVEFRPVDMEELPASLSSSGAS